MAHRGESLEWFASSLKRNARLMTTGLSSTLLTQTDDYRVGRFTITDTELRVCKTDAHRFRGLTIAITELRHSKTDAHMFGGSDITTMGFRSC